MWPSDSMVQRPLLVLGHLGLGDMLICNAMVRSFAGCGRQVVVVCKACAVQSTRHMYSDLPNVHLLPVQSDSDISPRFGARPDLLLGLQRAGYDLLMLGQHLAPLQPGSGFAEAFYQQAGLPAGTRYSGFHLPRDPQTEGRFDVASGRPYVFVHDDQERGYKVHVETDLDVVHPGKADCRPHSGNIFSFVGLMANASEIHCFDSSFAHLADLLDLCPGRRYLHCCAKNASDRCEDLFLRPGWRFVRPQA